MNLFKRASLPVLFLIAGCGCEEANPFLGKWNGGFKVSEAGGGTSEDLKRNDLIGYLQVYGTKNRFELFLRGEQQSITGKGIWSTEGNRMILRMNELAIDDAGGEAKRDMTKKFIPADDLRAAYQGTLVLDLSEDKQSYTGQKMNIGSLIGHHEFQKVTHKYTY